MNEVKKFERKDVGFIIAGAILGAIAGYIVKRIGIKNIVNLMRSKDLISSNIADTVTEFTDKHNLD